MSKPTREAYEELERAYSFFNDQLFDGRLPDCLITLQRSHDSKGYFSANQFVNRTDAVNAHEIALNPKWFAVRSLPETLATLVEGMVSLDQHLNSDNPPRRRYRNKEWAAMAEDIGLMASDTGEPGGKRTGDSVSTYIIDGGKFDLACSELLDQAFVLSWIDRFPPAESLIQRDPDTASLVGEANGLMAGEGVLDNVEPDLDRNAASAPAHTQDEGLIVPDTTVDLAGASQDESAPFADSNALVLTDTSGLDSSNDSIASGDTVGDKALFEAPQPDKGPAKKQHDRVSLDTLEKIGVDLSPPPKNPSKTKFNCPDCGANAWGRPSLHLHCSGHGDKKHDVVAMILVP